MLHCGDGTNRMYRRHLQNCSNLRPWDGLKGPSHLRRSMIGAAAATTATSSHLQSRRLLCEEELLQLLLGRCTVHTDPRRCRRQLLQWRPLMPW